MASYYFLIFINFTTTLLLSWKSYILWISFFLFNNIQNTFLWHIFLIPLRFVTKMHLHRTYVYVFCISILEKTLFINNWVTKSSLRFARKNCFNLNLKLFVAVLVTVSGGQNNEWQKNFIFRFLYVHRW